MTDKVDYTKLADMAFDKAVREAKDDAIIEALGTNSIGLRITDAFESSWKRYYNKSMLKTEAGGKGRQGPRFL